eukprot:CAMPEP_0176356326 /NCGR_PEP_ID=MMETSP0126-20121128/13935_1 /TAXON_ID=141414 ORGANISM="Strombidinopsis acuminatum, Strain SPMC142" /NCGR_SAMPLE_ID=MMETSP0126 /ASSEMBLY_ACC=CAM_ASM_000229 /LENGTH=100 /DNA_ID=CAMNT_0017709369 /DNA_START=1458 /DNA_END=1760 /DNA_ORIENTATION=+
MNPYLYAAITLTLYGIIMVGAIFLDDITKIFDFASAIAVTCIRFLFPAVFYLIAKKQYNITDRSPWFTCFAYTCCVLGAFNFGLGISSAIIAIVNAANGE